MSAQTLIFNNIELLGYNHQNNFFGENSFNYSATKTISLRGFVLDLQNSNGVNKIFNDTNQIKLLAQDFYEIIINNQNYGVGKIINLSFDPGNWVRTTRFNATIEILAEVPLQTLGSEFSSVILNDKKLNLIKNFSESFSIDFDVNNQILGGNHQIEIEYSADNKNINVIPLAQILAQELLKTLPTALAEGNYLTRDQNNCRFLYNENYDIINGKCGFNKKFSYLVNNVDQPFSVTRNISISIDNDGIASTEENCTIKAESDTPSLYQNALLGLNQEINTSFNRCQDLLNNYKTDFKIEKNLNQNPLQKTIQINKFDGAIDYKINFDNDKRKENQNYIWENTLTIDREENQIWAASEEGSINGVGPRLGILSDNLKYQKAEEGWNNIKTGIFFRVNNFWNEHAKNKASNSLKLLNTSLSKQPYGGTISYKNTYSDDPTLKTDLGNIKKLEIETTNNELKPIFKDYIVPNQGYVVRQINTDKNGQRFFEQGDFQIKITANIALSGQNDIFNGFSYFNTLKGFISTPSLSDRYIDSMSFQSDEIEQTVSLNIGYKYSQ